MSDRQDNSGMNKAGIIFLLAIAALIILSALVCNTGLLIVFTTSKMMGGVTTGPLWIVGCGVSIAFYGILYLVTQSNKKAAIIYGVTTLVFVVVEIFLWNADNSFIQEFAKVALPIFFNQPNT